MPSLAQQTIMGVATTSASATLITDDATVTSGLAEIDDSNFRDLFDGDKAVLIDACAPVSQVRSILLECGMLFRRFTLDASILTACIVSSSHHI